MYDEDAGATQVFNPDDPLMGVEWSVNVSDDETRTMRAPDIAFEYLRGGLDPNDTFVWRDGMGDWIPLGECQELLDVIRQYEGGQPSPAPSQAQPDAYAGDPDPYAGGASDPYAGANAAD
ncbi:MAG: GYF domain-containing protein, partial [Polyangiaceae bacterium]